MESNTTQICSCWSTAAIGNWDPAESGHSHGLGGVSNGIFSLVSVVGIGLWIFILLRILECLHQQKPIVPQWHLQWFCTMKLIVSFFTVFEERQWAGNREKDALSLYNSSEGSLEGGQMLQMSEYNLSPSGMGSFAAKHQPSARVSYLTPS